MKKIKKIIIMVAILILCMYINTYATNSESDDELNSINSVVTLTSETGEEVQDSNIGDTYKGFDTIGTIEIPKINLNCPVLGEVNTEALETSVAALYPHDAVLNSVGNLVIVGHNYRNGTFFSNNDDLVIGDEIYITGLNNDRIMYEVYDIFTADENDTSFYNRETNGKREITLITTDNDDTYKRLIVLAVESENQQQENDVVENQEPNENDNNNENSDESENNIENIQTNEDNEQDDTVTNNEENESIVEDNTITNKKMPYTGYKSKILFFIVTIIFLMLIIYYKKQQYKDIN